MEAAIIKEQGITFAVVVVKSAVLQSQQQSQQTSVSLMRYFPGMPIILMAQIHRGIPTYWGRTDIVKFLTNLHISQIPWKEYTFD